MARPLKYTSTLKSHSVEGLDQVMRRYREAAKRLEKNSNTGMIEFALHIDVELKPRLLILQKIRGI